MRNFLVGGTIWTVFWFIASQFVAAMLCQTVKIHRNADNMIEGTEVHMADPAVTWDFMVSPMFALPAVATLIVGWLSIWFVFHRKQNETSNT